jgi:hypothetical protein
MENKETRSIGYEDANVTLSDSRTVVGYGIVFNKMSRLIEGRFYEVILPEAIDGVLERSDVYALMNHEPSRGVLARSTHGMGSMKLQVDSKGVKYSFEAPTFDLGNELVEGIRRGDIRDSSFGFTVKPGGDKLERRGDGTYLRTIMKFDTIVDMSPCYRGAYVDTTVALRNLDEFKTINVDLPIETETKPVIAETIIEPIVEVAVAKRNMSDAEHYLRCENRKHKYNL